MIRERRCSQARLGRISGARLEVGVAAAISLLLVAGPFAFSSNAGFRSRCADGNGSATERGGWVSVRPPEFSEGDQSIVDYAVNDAPSNRPLLLVTNGRVVLRSRDEGCRWRQILSLRELTSMPVTELGGEPIPPARIVQIVAAGPFIYVAAQLLSPVEKPVIFVSDDLGDSFDDASAGLPPAGTIEDLQLHALGTAYALVTHGRGSPAPDADSDGIAAVYRRGDGADLWTRGAEVVGGTRVAAGQVHGTRIDGLEIDPGRPETIWLYGSGLLMSSDGGDSMSPVSAGALRGRRISAVDVYRRGATMRVLAFDADAKRAYMSYADGWRRRSVPGIVDSATSRMPDFYSIEDVLPRLRAAGARMDHWGPENFVISVDGVVYEHVPGAGFVDVSPQDGRPVHELDAATDNTDVTQRVEATGEWVMTSQIFGFNSATVEALEPEEDPPPPPPSVFVPEVEVRLKEPVLRPRKTQMTLEEGESRTVDYRLTLPPTPTPLDVYFLIDVSGSMGDAIAGVRRAMAQIARRLSGAGIDAWFGVGEYRSYDDDPPYRRVLDLVPPGDKLEEALEDLYAAGGRDETQLAALYQSATGRGQRERNAFIPPGQQANFRPGSLRVILHVTDEPFSEGPPHPTYAQVADALNAKAIGQVGLAIEGPGVGVGDPQEQVERVVEDRRPSEGLRRVANDTHTFALGAGVDCDGDGVPDLDPDQPLVCVIENDDADRADVMAPAIVNLLTSVSDYGAVRFEAVTRGWGDRSFRRPALSTTPDRVPAVNFKDFHRLDFEVAFRCPVLDRTERFDVVVRATSASRRLARAAATMTCRARPTDEVAAPSSLLPLGGGAVAQPPLVPPVAHPPEPIPEPNPNPQPQQAPQAHQQGAMAEQEQEQPRLAFVTVVPGAGSAPAVDAGGDQYHMSSAHRRDGFVDVPGPLYAAALTLGLAFGWAASIQRRMALKRVGACGQGVDRWRRR